MTRYLTCVFKVMFETQPGTAERVGVSAEELASATAEQAFEEVDEDHNGSLTFEEFQRWYSGAGELGVASDDFGKTESRWWSSLHEVRRVSGGLLAQDVCVLAAEATDDEGLISIDSYSTFCQRLIDCGAGDLNPADRERLQLILARLFELFDHEDDGAVDFTDLATGLSELCGDSRDDKAAAAFGLYDYRDSGEISLDDMTRYLTCVFKVMFEFQPGTAERVGVSAEQLAAATAEQAFEEADEDRGGTLTFEEFLEWYSQSAPSPDREDNTDRPASWSTLEDVRAITGLGEFSVDDIFEVFAGVADTDGTVSLASFRHCFDAIAEASGGATAAGSEVRDHLIQALFDAFDDGSGGVDFSDLSPGLSVLCGGRQDDKAAAAFAMYDYNGDGVISLEEMTRYLTSVFTVVFVTQPGTAQRVGVSAEELAAVTAEQAFGEADSDENGVISFEEFSAWIRYSVTSRGSLQYLTVDANDDSYGFPEIRREGSVFVGYCGEYKETGIGQFAAPQWLTRDTVSVMLGFQFFSFDAILTLFKAASVRNMLSVESFGRCMDELVGVAVSHGVDQECQPHYFSKCKLMISRLYAVFDPHNEGMVSLADVMCGLQTLIKDSAASKRAAVFELLDSERSGVLPAAAIHHYFNNFFRTLFEVEPLARDEAAGETVETFVESVCADFEAFCAAAGVQQVDSETFELWHAQPSDTAASDDSDEEGMDQEAPVNDTLSLVRRVLSLNTVSFDELCDVLAENSDGAGTMESHISIEALEGAFSNLRSLAGAASDAEPNDLAELVAVVPALAAHYLRPDAASSGAGDSISVVDVILGMSVFYGGLNEATEAAIRRALRVPGTQEFSDPGMVNCISMILRTFFYLSNRDDMLTDPSSVAGKREAADLFATQAVEKLHERFGPQALSFQQFAEWPGSVA